MCFGQRSLITHLPCPELQPEANRELSKCIVHVGNNCGNRWGSCDRGGAGMSDVHPNNHRGRRLQPSQCTVVDRVVNSTQLGVRLESNVREVLILLSLIFEDLLELHTNGVDAEFGIAKCFDSRVDEVISARKEEQYHLRKGCT